MSTIFNNPISAFRKIQSLPHEKRELGWAILSDETNRTFHVYTFLSRAQLADFILQVEEENAIATSANQVTLYASIGRFASFHRNHVLLPNYLHLYIKMEEPTTATERWDALRKFMEISVNAA